jgi:hypothetical protein
MTVCVARVVAIQGSDRHYASVDIAVSKPKRSYIL